MIRLSCYDIARPIEFSEDKINTLVIEDPFTLRNFIEKMILQINKIESKFTLSKDFVEMDFTKNVEVITDIFNIAFDSRTISNKVAQAINTELNSYTKEVTDIVMKINCLASELSAKLDFDASFTEFNDLNGIFKLLNFQIDADTMTSLERLLQYLDFLAKYLKKELFVLVNLELFFTEKELKEFEKLVKYKKLNVLLIEGSYKGKIFDGEDIRIIDKDLCEI